MREGPLREPGREASLRRATLPLLLWLAPGLTTVAGAAPSIGAVTTNESAYPGGQVPRFARLEITFALGTVAGNPQLPYDPAPPAGIAPGVGVSVDALLTPDDWVTTYTQPAFRYQEFDRQVKSGRDWLYPTAAFSWKVRFTPDRVGAWQFKLRARDAGGTSETAPQGFTVGESGKHGFVRVSARDPRYFEHDDGTYFPGLGYNMNYDHVSWTNPLQENVGNFQKMAANGIQLARVWLSEWGIFTSAWNPWNAINGRASAYIPYTGLTFAEAYPGSEVSMQLYWDPARADRGNPCMFIGAWKAPPAVKRSTTYRVRVRYKTAEMAGPAQAGSPYGFVAKTGGWLWGSGSECYLPGTGTPVTGYQSQDTGWTTLEGTWASGGRDFLPNFYLALENASGGRAYVDCVWIEEDLGGGRYGPNIVSKPWMAHHLYFEQRNSYAFDRVLELAEQMGIYLRPVILEKNEWAFNRIDFDGSFIPSDPLCSDGDPSNDPPKCPGNGWFYGDWRRVAKVRWLQQAWWRYLQARWGYSTAIHSWEILNEGDPFDGRHYTLVDEFGKYMRQFRPDHHLVSTSNWHSFPRDDFWANPSYPNVDFADYHHYVNEGDATYADTARETYERSMQYGARRAGGAGKPVIRGELGFVANLEPGVEADTEGVWLHNLIWGGVNPGGMLESYWYDDTHIYSGIYDHRPLFRPYWNFMRDVPLSNGSYVDAAAVTSATDLRAWGQRDSTSGRAHLWLSNARHTWKNVVDGVAIPPVSGTVRVGGFRAGQSVTVEWWDTLETDRTAQVVRAERVRAAPDGVVTLSVDALATDVAVKLWPRDPPRRGGAPAHGTPGYVLNGGRGPAPCPMLSPPARGLANRGACRGGS